MTLPSPGISESLLVRTDFSDDAAWEAVLDVLDEVELRVVDDPAFDGLTVERLLAVAADDEELSHAFLADETTMTGDEQTLLVVDLYEGSGRTFRVTPGEVATVHAKLLLADVAFDELADAVAPDGVFRG